MDNSYGSFKRDIYYMGSLFGANLVDGAAFVSPDFEDGGIPCGIGNRVNLYIINSVNYIDSETPPQYGLILDWYIKSTERYLDSNDKFSINFWASFADGVHVSREWNGMFIENDDASPANPYVKAANANYNFISLPNKATDDTEGWFSGDGRRYFVVPVTALGDYLRVRFYSNPVDYEYSGSVRIFSMVGHDATGSANKLSPS
jgi:hypothetical protein